MQNEYSSVKFEEEECGSSYLILYGDDGFTALPCDRGITESSEQRRVERQGQQRPALTEWTPGVNSSFSPTTTARATYGEPIPLSPRLRSAQPPLSRKHGRQSEMTRKCLFISD